jgi:8-oxo-dGTP diphosphatase
MIYNKKPKEFFPDIEVVACLMECNGEFILLHRQDNKIHGDKWGQPAGKVDPSDVSIFDAMVRELGEETGVYVKKEDLIFYKTFFVSHPDRDFLYHYFILHLKEKPEIILSKKEHKDFSWVTPNNALQMPLIMDEDHCIKDYYGIK